MGKIATGVVRRLALGFAVAAAALLASACYWTAVSPLMPASAAETASPIPPGRYVTSSGSTLNVGYVSGSVVPVSGPTEQYRVKFDHMSGDLYLAEAIGSGGSIYYVLIQPNSNGFIERAMQCDSIAEAAGAVVRDDDEEGRCVFSRYDQLVNATRTVIARFRSDPAYLPGTQYSR